MESKAPDEDFLPFKAMYSLMSRGARIHIEPEAAHGLWNATKSALLSSGLNSANLIGMLLSQVDHGPFSSGSNFVRKKEVLDYLIQNISHAEFCEMVQSIASDRDVKVSEDTLSSLKIPDTKEDLLNENAVAKLSHNAPEMCYATLPFLFRYFFFAKGQQLDGQCSCS
jgi:hypothetical protein